MDHGLERGVLFLTAPPELVVPLLADVRAQHPQVAWTVYYRGSEAAQLAEAMRGMEAIDDKPKGSKLEFLRALRRRRFAHGVIAWTGHRHYDRMKLVGLLCGARNLWVYDENGTPYALSGNVWSWMRCVRWPYLGESMVLTGVALRLYKWTLGLLLAGMRLAVQAKR